VAISGRGGTFHDSQNFTKNVVGYCTSHNEQAWGFIKNHNGEIVQSCRCEKPCSHFDECMGEQYAKKIARENIDMPQGKNKLVEKPDRVALEGMLSKILLHQVRLSVEEISDAADKYCRNNL
jgi:hypothetical protein